jgi:hypothetical protein
VAETVSWTASVSVSESFQICLEPLGPAALKQIASPPGLQSGSPAASETGVRWILPRGADEVSGMSTSRPESGSAPST